MAGASKSDGCLSDWPQQSVQIFLTNPITFLPICSSLVVGFLSRTMEIYFHTAEQGRRATVKTFQGLSWQFTIIRGMRFNNKDLKIISFFFSVFFKSSALSLSCHRTTADMSSDKSLWEWRQRAVCRNDLLSTFHYSVCSDGILRLSDLFVLSLPLCLSITVQLAAWL